MRRAIMLMALMAAGAVASGQGLESPAMSRPMSRPPQQVIRLVDPDGKPVTAARVLVTAGAAEGYTFISPEAVGTGVAEFDVPLSAKMQGKSSAVVWVGAPGFAYKRAEFTPVPSDDVTVTLDRGKSVVFDVATRDGAPLGDKAVMFAHTSDTMHAVWWSYTKAFEGSLDLAPARRDGNRFTATVPMSGDPMWFVVDAPGQCALHVVGPLDPDDLTEGQTVKVELPATGRLEARFVVADEVRPKVAETELNLTLWRTMKLGLPGQTPERFGVKVAEASSPATGDAMLLRRDLPAGDYNLEATTGGERRYDKERADYFNDRRQVTVAEGQNLTEIFTFEVFDEVSLKGTQQATVTITRANGQPATKGTYRVLYEVPTTGRVMPVATGTVDATGSFTVKDINGANKRYKVVFENTRLGELVFENPDEPLVTTLTLPPGTGDEAPDFTATRLDDGAEFTLSSLKGQVVAVDFWATWCGPCQEPMAHNAEILKKRGADWAGKATIIGLSCDDEIETLRGHVAKKGWENVPHVWSSGWENPGFDAYKISGVPTMVIIDQQGRIAKRGHPASMNVEKEIDKLLANPPS